MSNIISIDKAKKRRGKPGKYVVLMLCLLCVSVIFGYQLINKNQISVVGNELHTEETIKDIVGIHEKTNLFIYKLAKKEPQLGNYPYIENIDIQYTSFNKVQLIVNEKSVISYIPYMGKYLCLDKDGRVIDYTNDVQPEIPIVRGLSFDHFVIGDKLFHNREDIFDAILEISHKMVKFDLKIAYIDFNYNDPDQIEIKIDNISIRIGNIQQINRKFELLKEYLQKIPSGVKGVFDLRKPDDNEIIFQPDNRK
ncbi:FtsQ-type POTRA domain-containing protein [Vallitalea pronyensis]|uniref:FtsQ-type POTRA domain-containing protein n=1 Tax=Vallitalea pronyensis TaxID=1348613 RepID=A0A8J8MKK6_9FIRM|nr:FtsQ-type POTRA domain-containing protein [Vallitalea pronyensis]QUI23209.1 FtsQ-type POTRA domain-containing protein [Vallitalea pronyensis]